MGDVLFVYCLVIFEIRFEILILLLVSLASCGYFCATVMLKIKYNASLMIYVEELAHCQEKK